MEDWNSVIFFTVLTLAVGGPLLAAAAAGDAAKHPAKPAAGPTGVLSEDEFMALHELRRDAPPPLRGSMIEMDVPAAPRADSGAVATAAAYLSLPAGVEPPLAGIVVIHEWWGLNDHIKHWCDRLAASGYAALAVDLYGGVVATTPEQAMAMVKAVDEGRALAVLEAAHAFLGRDPRIAAARRAVIGWCFGGGWSLRTAIAVPDLEAAVIYYGHPITDVDELRRIRAPLLCIFGNRDQSIPPAAVDRFDEALTAAGVEHEILRYDAAHAFANPSGAHYEQVAAADAWKHVQGFLARRLGGVESRDGPREKSREEGRGKDR